MAAIESIRLTTPWAFEYADAEPTTADHVYLREVRQSDLLVLVASNSHSPAVQREIETAESVRRPIFAFVRRSVAGQETDLTREVLRWLEPRVKYRYFGDVAELREVVANAVASEIVRGYRAYRERLTSADVETLLTRVASPPGLIVRPATEDDQTELREILQELEPWYPSIGAWIPKALADLSTGTGEVRVARVAEAVAAVAISREKEEGVRKFSTLYVRADHRGTSVGPHLVHDEVVRAERDGIRKGYVTFADELHRTLSPMFTRAGFIAEGVSAGRYRAKAAEWVYSKRFLRMAVDDSGFGQFVDDYLVREQGGRIVRHRGSLRVVRVPHEPLLGMPTRRDTIIICSVSEVPEDEYERWSARIGDRPWVFISLYGRPADVRRWSHQAENWIDGEDLRTRFFPLRLVTTEQSLICTIRPAYADALIPLAERPQLFAPERLQIRPDNVFNRTPDRHVGLRRGARISFYVSNPEMNLRGSARLRELLVDSPEACLERYGEIGILQFSELNEIARKHKGKVLALAFDWYTEHPTRLSLRQMKAILGKYNPVSAWRVTFDEQQAIEAAASGAA